MKKPLTTFISLSLVLSACNGGQSSELLDASLWTVPYSIEGGEGLNFKLPETLSYAGGGDTDGFSRSFISGGNGEAAYFNITSFVLQKCPADDLGCGLDNTVPATPEEVFEAEVAASQAQGEWTDGGEITVGNTTGRFFTSSEENIEYDMVLFYGSEGAYRADNYVSPELFDIFLSTFEVTQDSAADNGDFTFTYSSKEDSYLIDVLYKGESVGSIEKEVPADGYEAYLMEEAGGKAFIAVNPTGLGGYILYGHAFEVYVYDFANQTFEVLPVTGVDDISADGNLVAYWTTWEGPAGDFWGAAVYDLSQDVNVSNYQVDEEFDEGGNATFSPSGENLAFELADKDDEENGEEHVLFLGAAVGGEYKEMGRQVNEYFSMDWEANETLKNFEVNN